MVKLNSFFDNYIFLFIRYGVALYYPPGNFPNQYMENVQPRSELEDGRLA
jgi:hypothetical protein